MKKEIEKFSRREFLNSIFYFTGIALAGRVARKIKFELKEENFKEAYFYKRIKD